MSTLQETSENLLSFCGDKRYSTIYADPPWRFQNRTGKVAPENKKLNRYETMSLADIMALPVEQVAAAKSHLYLWVPNALLPDGLAVMKAWGFEYKSVAFVWLKLNKSGKGWFYGLGFWTRGNAKICLLATKGHPKRKSNRVHQFIISPLRGHSQKPDEARDKIIELVGDLPRVELFAREKADGWDVWGNEVDCDIEIEGYRERTGGDFVVG